MKITRLLLRTLSVLILIPLLLGGALAWLDHKNFFDLEHIDVLIDGTKLEPHYLKPQVEEVEELIEQSRGISLWRLDLVKLRQQIQALPWVENVTLVREWPSTLKAKILPFDVKVLLMTKKGQFIPVVENGEVLNPIPLKNVPDATILRGDKFQKDPELRKKALKILDEIPVEGSFSRPKISEMYFKDKEGFWVTLIQSGIEVRLGQEEVSMKSSRVGQVIDYLESHQLEARVIDADLSQKVLVRLRKAP